MKNKKLLCLKYKLSGILLIWLLFSGCLDNNKSTVPPNIIWITSEDNSKHYYKLYDENGIATPNIEMLAEQGITFTHAFSNAPVCSVARSTLISSCFAPRIGSQFHRRDQFVPMPQGIEMFPAYLKKAGYYTTNNYKEDYNMVKAENVWDESSKEATYKNRPEGTPFFHMKNIGSTHESNMFFDYQEDSLQSNTIPDNSNLQPNHPQTPLFSFSNKHFKNRITIMDAEVGKLLDELKEEGLLESTIIFYFGDHGGALPGSKGYVYETGVHVPLIVYIPAKYEKMIAHKPGSSCDAFVSFVDFGATVLNIAGIPIPEGIDGKPFLGYNIQQKEMDERNTVFSYADRMDEKYDMVRAVRVGNYKYIRNFTPSNYDGLRNNYRYRQLAYQQWLEMFNSGQLNEVQAAFFKPKSPEMLFDLSVDPFETKDLSQNPEFSDILSDMRTKLDNWVTEMPDLSFYPEYELINAAFYNPSEFGQKQKAAIKKYLSIANLMLSDFEDVKNDLEVFLKSDDPWERYWAIIVYTRFGSEALEILPVIEHISITDPIMLNRVRAAEFIGITGSGNPLPCMTDALSKAIYPKEALKILNSIVLMKDGYGYPLSLNNSLISTDLIKNHEINLRLSYLVNK